MTTKRAARPRKKKSYWEFTNDIVKYLKTHFYLHAWHIHVVQMKDAKDKSNLECYNGEDVLAGMASDSNYLESTLRLYPLAKKMYKDGRYSEFGVVLVHEFCHILTDPLYKIAIDAVSNREGPNLEHVRENTTQLISVIVMPGIDKKIFSPYKVTRKR
jgi:hypothetical protein